MKKYDSIIIGAGQAGPSMAASLASSGERVALVERKWFGGTCVNNGCTPTKTLIASAKSAYNARRSIDFGVRIDGRIEVDMKKVKARKDALVNASNSGLEEWMKGTPNIDVYEAHAHFVDNYTLEVGNEKISAEKIFINTGGRARVLDKLKEVPYLTNSTVMDLDFVPPHLVIVGGSYIGLEFAQMYRRFGSEVTVIEMSSRIVKHEDEEVSLELQKILEREGVKFRFNAECILATKDGDEIVVNVDCKNGQPQIKGSHLLLAIGRIPNTDDLGLENTNIKTNDRGYIIVDDCLKTNVENIWALGDINAKGSFTHTAYNDFEIVRDQLINNDKRSTKDRILCYALYTDPPLARIGITEKEALQSGKKILKGYRPFTKIARAKEMGEELGFMKILIDCDTEEILGATILGVNGDEVIHSLLDIMYAKKSYKTIQRAVHIHPTISELIPTMLGELKELK